MKFNVWRPKAGWMTPGGSEGDGYDGVAAGRRVTNESHLTIKREVLDELLKKWCQQEKDAVGPRVSIPAELPEELARLGFDSVHWAEAYRRTARRFDRLAWKAEGMRRDFERVWNGGRMSAKGHRDRGRRVDYPTGEIRAT